MDMRRFFTYSSIGSLLIVLLLSFFVPHILYLLIIIIPYILIGIYDLRSTHNVLRNYPVLGHLRYMFEFIRPEIQQYFINTNQSGRPFDREVRNLVYQRAKNVNDTLPFGTQRDIDQQGYVLAYHSLHPCKPDPEQAYVTVGGEDCKQPYRASRLNISAMSFGALSANAIMAMNKGAKIGAFAHNTGEGGLSEYHLQGGDVIWQIGTAYFGCRTLEGNFDEALFKKKANHPNVKMIEIKLSQGAKPSHGGILPAAKITEEIANIRHVKLEEDCISPPAHSEFSTPEGLCHFIDKLRQLTNGKPIGFKLCLGQREQFMGICKAMLATKIYPDFITVDGAEGGTGAAPLEFSNRLGIPSNEALAFVHNCLVGCGIRDKIKIISSGKVATGFDMLVKHALGADMCNSARAMMFAVGCIQALRCNQNTCPTGVTTQDPNRMRALIVDEKCNRVANYHKHTINSLLEITGALGIHNISDISPVHIHKRINGESVKSFDQIYPQLQPNDLVKKKAPEDYMALWKLADAKSF